MFSYLSGFVSELDLDQNADVYVYLLFPQRYAQHLKRDLFRGFMDLNKDPRSNHLSSVTQSGYGSIHDEYIPFALPFKASYVRDTGVYLDGEKCPVIEWLETNFKIDMNDFLNNLSERRLPNEPSEIGYDNIMDYVTVAFEHQDFVNCIHNEVIDDDDFMRGVEYTHEFYSFYKLSLTQELMIGKDLTLLSSTKTKYEMVMNGEEYEKDFNSNQELFIESALVFASLRFFMVNLNKIFKPCSRGGQRCSRKYDNLLNRARTETNELLYKGYEDE